MRKKVGLKSLLFMSFFALPMTVFALSEEEMGINLPVALFMEAFVSIHMSVFVLMPLANLFSDDPKKLFWKLFKIRVAILVFFDLFVTPAIAIFDFFAVFVGTFIVVPIASICKGKNFNTSSSVLRTAMVSPETVPVTLMCPKCGRVMAQGNTWCSVCGTHLIKAPIASNSTQTTPTQKTDTLVASSGVPFNRAEYDPIFFQSEKEIALSFINKQLKEDSTISRVKIPEIEKRKNIFTLIYLVIVSILAIIYFLYHVGTFLVGLFTLVTIIYVVLLLKYNLKNYLLKEIQSRPDEKISYVVSSILSGNPRTSLISSVFGRIAMIFGVFLILCSVFWEPHMIFEETDGGYAIRYYTIGIARRDSTISIPSKYKGEVVVSIRGNVFKNLWFIENVEIPDTVTEIRGGAFQDCGSLRVINLPPNIKEVKGSTFENCYSLESIAIPEGVTRIGGSAFRNCSRLSSVVIPKTVLEIGSSAFRGTAIHQVCISSSAYVNERAFKETYANITYYENGCVDNYGYNNGYNNEY